MMFIAIKTEDGAIKGKISFYCRVTKEGYLYAYVWNREEEFGEIGSIQIKMEQGGLVRVA